MKQGRTKNIDTWQIKLIHVAANQLGLIWKKEQFAKSDFTEDPYRQILSGFKNKNGEPATSCKELNFAQANILLQIFNQLGFKTKTNNQFAKRFPKDRPSQYASVKQLGLLMGLWTDKSREKTLESLNKFQQKITGVSSIEFMQKQDVQKVKLAIENLK